MPEHVGRIPLTRRRRKRPRKPTFLELLGLIYLTVGLAFVPVYVNIIGTGRFIDAGRSSVNTLFERISLVVGGIGIIFCIGVGALLAWDWLKDPWEDV